MRFARDAGFPGAAADMAAKVAFAASGWRDAHYVAHPSDPDQDEIGLWALSPSLTGAEHARDLLDPVKAAVWAYQVWEVANRNWRIFPVVTHAQGRTFVVAARQVEAGSLLTTTADNMPHLMEPSGARFRGRDATTIMRDAPEIT